MIWSNAQAVNSVARAVKAQPEDEGRFMVSKRTSPCRLCGYDIVAGDEIYWFPKQGNAEHYDCFDALPLPEDAPPATKAEAGFTILADDGMWLTTDIATGEAVYAMDIEQALDFIRNTVQNAPVPLQLVDVEQTILDAEQALNDLPRSQISEPEEPQEIQDGTYTVVFGDESYVTIRIKAAGPNSNLFGKRVVSYLFGPDNSNDFTGFGFYESGICRVWSRFKADGAIGKYVNAVNVLSSSQNARQGAGLAYALKSSNCCRCGRKLTVPASIHNGMGPECATKGGF